MRVASNIFLLKNSFEEKLKEIFLTLFEIHLKIVDFKEVLIINNGFVKLDGILSFENELSSLLDEHNIYAFDCTSLPMKGNQSITFSLKDILYELNDMRFNIPAYGNEDDLSKIEKIKKRVANLIEILETKFAF